MSGLFILAKKKDELPYLIEGKKISLDKPIGVLEVMKIRSKVYSPCEGTIENILLHKDEPDGWSYPIPFNGPVAVIKVLRKDLPEKAEYDEANDVYHIQFLSESHTSK
jgi:hypothetical protein